MKRIFKYPLTRMDSVELPAEAMILDVGLDPKDGELKVWAIVDPDAELVQVPLMVLVTGSDVPSDLLPHLRTIITPEGFVFHVFGHRLAPKSG